MKKYLMFFVIPVIFFHYYSYSQTDSLYSEEFIIRMSDKKENDKKIERITEFIWKIKTTHTEYRDFLLLKIENDSLIISNGFRKEKIALFDLQSLSFSKTSLLYPGVVIGGLLGGIAGSVIILNSTKADGIAGLTLMVLGFSVGASVGIGVLGYIGSLIKIYNHFEYSGFSTKEKKYLIYHEILPDFEVKDIDSTLRKRINDLTMENKRNEDVFFLEADYLTSYNLTLGLGYLFNKSYGFHFGYSNPEKESYFILSDYIPYYGEIIKHRISFGYCDSYTEIGTPVNIDGQIQKEWAKINGLVGHYKFSFYSLSVGIGTFIPFKSIENSNISRLFISFGYTYFFD